MGMSDIIAAYILNRMDQADDGWAELKRNELADRMGCVPSQINYVLTSRFTPEQGYIVESRRGGGGYVRVRRVRFSAPMSPLMHVVNSLGDSVPAGTARTILQNLYDRKIIDSEAATLMSAAVSNRALAQAPPAVRDAIRADLLKCMLTVYGDAE